MDKISFDSAAQVRAFIKERRGERVRVRWRNNPFGGTGLFFVSVVVPRDTRVSLVSFSSSTTPCVSWSSPDAAMAGMCAEYEALLRTTANARFEGVVQGP
jgi:hypothetical protein